MTDIINLRQARKNKKREQAAKQGAENRVRFGRDKATKEREAMEKTMAEKIAEGHKIEVKE
jgi:hypothetical protein